MAMWVKIFLAVFAFSLALIQLFELKSFSEDPTAKIPKWKRLTRYGYAKLTIAALTLVLGGLNEYLSLSSARSSKIAAELEKNELNSTLNASRDKIEQLGGVLQQMGAEQIALIRTNSYLSLVLDSSVVKGGLGIVQPENMTTETTIVRAAEGSKFDPKKGDEIQWNFNCFSGALPQLQDAEQQYDCRQAGYGRLLAYSYPIILDQISGRKPLVGTRSNDGEMVYKSPIEYSQCSALAENMAKSSCELQITIWSQAKNKILEMEDRLKNLDPLDLSPEAANACRKYAALSGETCEEALKRKQ